MNRRTAVRVALAIAATAAFAAVVAATMDLDALAATMRGAEPAWLAVGIVAAMSTTLLRAARLGVLVEGRVDRGIAAASVAHNALTALLPMKLGEFALPLLLSRLRRMPVSGGLGVLVLLRGFDLLALGVLGAAAMAVALPAAGHAPMARLAAAAAVAGVTVSVLLVAGWPRMSSWLRGAGPVRRSPALQKLLAAVTQTPRLRALHCLWLSLLVWVALFASFYCFSRAIALPVGPAMAAAIGAAASLAFAFPISGIANVGPFQAAWVWMSTLLGLQATSALAASLLAHGAVVVATAVLALLAAPVLWPLLRTGRGAGRGAR